MRGGTLFSGIGTPELAAPQIDWRWCAEIDPFASAVLRQRFPHIKNLGDVGKIDAGSVEHVDLVVFGSPCQSFSVAGRRLGLDDPRGNLALVALAVVARVRPRWFVFENVPGLLSSDSGRDFGAFLGTVGELGYGWAYATLDAQFFGVPQRRRRLFVVGHSGGEWRHPAAVLFEPESLRWHPAPRREAGERVAPTIAGGSNGGGANGSGRDADSADSLVALAAQGDGDDGGDLIAETLRSHPRPGSNSLGNIASTLRGNDSFDHAGDEGSLIAHALTAEGFDASEDGTGCGAPLIPIQSVQAVREKKQNDLGIGGTEMFTLTARDQHAVAYDITGALATNGGKETDIHTALRSRQPGGSEASTTTVVAFRENSRNEVKFVEGGVTQGLTTGGGKPGRGYPAVAFTERTRADGRNLEAQEDLAYALCNPGSGGRTHSRQLLDQRMSVRRLTPMECERLQALPDGFTAITYRGKPAADGPRYRAIGNAMCANVIGWILKRIMEADHAGAGTASV